MKNTVYTNSVGLQKAKFPTPEEAYNAGFQAGKINALLPLQRILAAYRYGEREMPTYAELVALSNQE